MGEFVSALGNPWLPDTWNVTTQGQFVLRYGMRRAILYAALGGTTVGGTMRRPAGERQVFIFNKKIGSIGGGGQGTSGGGAPTP